MNIAKILKNCPKGTKLYSSIFGEVELLEVQLNEKFPITVEYDNNKVIESFTEDGKLYSNYNDAECVLFPSKENRDWSNFKVPKKEEYNFKPFDKVLVRDYNDDVWLISFFAYINTIGDYKYQTISNAYKQCIPFEGNEHLLGTSKSIN